MLIAGKPVTLNGMVKDGFSMLAHLGTLSMRGASPGAEALTMMSRSAIAAAISRHSTRRRRVACTMSGPLSIAASADAVAEQLAVVHEALAQPRPCRAKASVIMISQPTAW